jgi:hypothetical protein
MTNIEYSQILEFMKNKIFATKDEILNLILENNPTRNPSYERFYLFDLTRANIIYKYDNNRYKYNGKLKQFKYEFNNSDLDLKHKIETRFDDIQLCIWNTSFLSQYMNLLPYDYFTFVEIDKNYMELLFDFLKNDYRILYQPNQKELDLYTSKKNQIILKKITSRAPLDKTYESYIGINKNLGRSKRVVLSPKIEKIIVDIFAETNSFSVFNELYQIYEGIFKAYCINFQKLFYYAKNRGIYERLKKFISFELHYNLEKGEFK